MQYQFVCISFAHICERTDCMCVNRMKKKRNPYASAHSHPHTHTINKCACGVFTLLNRIMDILSHASVHGDSLLAASHSPSATPAAMACSLEGCTNMYTIPKPIEAGWLAARRTGDGDGKCGANGVKSTTALAACARSRRKRHLCAC